jgi:sugar phosphate isomerase/epimerase
VLEDANAREQRYVVSPSVAEDRHRTLDDWKRLCATFNAIGAQAQRAGLAFAYHNHDFEFAAVEGQIPYQLLLANTDPALVGMELDLYWMTHAGHDPVAWFQRYPGRFPLLHLKDATPVGAITDVGSGTIDFKRILGVARGAGVTHGFVEHDDPVDPMRSIERSLVYLKTLDPT